MVMWGHLASLDTLDEMYWMKGFRGYHSTLHGEAWIGGRRMNGVWKWVADKPEANQQRSPILTGQRISRTRVETAYSCLEQE